MRHAPTLQRRFERAGGGQVFLPGRINRRIIQDALSDPALPRFSFAQLRVKRVAKHGAIQVIALHGEDAAHIEDRGPPA